MSESYLFETKSSIGNSSLPTISSNGRIVDLNSFSSRVFRLRANQEAYNGANLALDEESVDVWKDISGSRYNVSAASGEEPTFKEAEVNGLAAIEFDGVDDRFTMHNLSGLDWTKDLSVFIVAKQSTEGERILQKINGTGAQINAIYFSGNVGLVIAFMRPQNNFPLYADNALTVYSSTWEWSTKTVTNYINGEACVPIDDLVANGTHLGGGAMQYAGTPTLNGDPLYIGARYDGIYLNGQICEIIWLAEKVSDSNRQKIEGQLALDYGLTANLATGHPYKDAS